MTLGQIISDALETEGLDELVEAAFEEEVSAICSRLDVRGLLRDALREAVHERRDRIEDAITEQLELIVDDVVEDYL